MTHFVFSPLSSSDSTIWVNLYLLKIRHDDKSVHPQQTILDAKRMVRWETELCDWQYPFAAHILSPIYIYIYTPYVLHCWSPTAFNGSGNSRCWESSLQQASKLWLCSLKWKSWPFLTRYCLWHKVTWKNCLNPAWVKCKGKQIQVSDIWYFFFFFWLKFVDLWKLLKTSFRKFNFLCFFIRKF